MAGDSDGPIGTGAANVAGFLGESAAVVTTREPPKRRFSNPPRPWPLLVISPVAPLSPWLCSSEPTRLGSLLLRVRFGCSTASLLIFSAASACWFSSSTSAVRWESCFSNSVACFEASSTCLVSWKLLATSKSGTLLLGRDQGEMAVFWDSRSRRL